MSEAKVIGGAPFQDDEALIKVVGADDDDNDGGDPLPHLVEVGNSTESIEALTEEEEEEEEEDRIIGGFFAGRAQFPFMVHLSNVGCGGTLVRERNSSSIQQHYYGTNKNILKLQVSTVWMVTAAHCTVGRSFVAMCLGDNDRNCNNGGQRRVAFRSRNQIIEHERYVDFSEDPVNGYFIGGFDIALVRVNPAVRLTQSIQRALLWGRPIRRGSRLNVVGWGREDPNVPGGTRFLKAVREEEKDFAFCCCLLFPFIIVAAPYYTVYNCTVFAVATY